MITDNTLHRLHNLNDYKERNGGTFDEHQCQQNDATDCGSNRVILNDLTPLSFSNNNNNNNNNNNWNNINCDSDNSGVQGATCLLPLSYQNKSRSVPLHPPFFHSVTASEANKVKSSVGQGLAGLPRELLERIITFAGHETIDALSRTCETLANQLPVDSASFWWGRWREEVCGPNGLGALLLDPLNMESGKQNEGDRSPPPTGTPAGSDPIGIGRSPDFPKNANSGSFGISKKNVRDVPKSSEVLLLTWINPPLIIPSEDNFHLNRAEGYGFKCEGTPPIPLLPLRIWASCDGPGNFGKNEVTFFSENPLEENDSAGNTISGLKSADNYMHQITSKKLSLYHLFEVFCPNPEDYEESQKKKCLNNNKTVARALVDEKKRKLSNPKSPRKVTVIIPDTGTLFAVSSSANTTDSYKSSQSHVVVRRRMKYRIRFCAHQYRSAIRLIHRWKLAQKKEEDRAQQKKVALNVGGLGNDGGAALSESPTSFREEFSSSSESSASFESSVSSPAVRRYARERAADAGESSRGPLSPVNSALEEEQPLEVTQPSTSKGTQALMPTNHSSYPSDSIGRSDSQQLVSINSIASATDDAFSPSSACQDKRPKKWKQSHQTFSDAIKKKSTRKHFVLKPSSTCGTLQAGNGISGKWVNSQGEHAFVYSRRINLLSYNNTLTDLSEGHPSSPQSPLGYPPPMTQEGRSPTFISVPNSPMGLVTNPRGFDEEEEEEKVEEVRDQLIDSQSNGGDMSLNSEPTNPSRLFDWSPERNWSLFHPDYKHILYNGSSALSPSPQPFHLILHSSVSRFWTAGYLRCFMTAEGYHAYLGRVDDDDIQFFEEQEPGGSNRETQRTSFSLLQPLNDILSSTQHSPVRPFSSARAFPSRPYSPPLTEGNSRPSSSLPPTCSLFEWTHVLNYQERLKMYDSAYTQSNFLFSAGLNNTDEVLTNLNSTVPSCAGLLFPIAIPPDTSANTLKLWENNNSSNMLSQSHFLTGIPKKLKDVVGSSHDIAPRKMKTELVWFRARLVQEHNDACHEMEGNRDSNPFPASPAASAATLLYAPSHIALYLSLLRFTSVFDLQHARGETEDRYLVHTRIISPVTGKVVSLSFFYRHRHVGCPLMWIKMELLLPKREFERASKIIDNETDDDTDLDTPVDVTGDLCGSHPSPRRGSSPSAGGVNRSTLEDDEERALLFQGGMGRVELDVAPHVDHRGMRLLVEALALPPRFPLTLVWNVVVYASMMGVEVWEQFGSTFFTTYRTTFTDAVLKMIAEQEEETAEKNGVSDRQQRTRSTSLQTPTSSSLDEHSNGSTSLSSSSSSLSSFV